MWGALVAVQSFLWIGVICGKEPCRGEYTFPCSNGQCTKMSYLCDNDNDCGDNSDEKLCGTRCPKYSYECDGGSTCYHYSKRCDATLDCSDASDETNCDALECETGHYRCSFGGCAQSRDLCCPIRNGSCVQPNINFSTNANAIRLIFANRQDLYSQSLANNERQILHRDENFNITALAYSAVEHMLFWAAGPIIWSASLVWGRKYNKPLGSLHFDCTVRIMAFDWITQNFYLVCDHSTRITVCGPHTANNSILCSHLIAIDLWRVTWLGLNPHAGLIFVGGLARRSFEIFEAEIDGSSQRRIYQGEGAIPECSLNIKKNEISLLHTDGNGNLSFLNLSNRTLHQTGSKFIRLNTVARALAGDVAILQDRTGSFALFFWHNGTVFKQKSIDMTSTSEVSLVIEPEAQPPSENRCKNFKCDHICLLGSSGPFCKCDFAYELSDNKHSCKLPAGPLKSMESEALGIVPEIPRAHSSTENSNDVDACGDSFIHIFYITVIILSVCCGAAIYLRSRIKLCEARTVFEMTSSSVSLAAAGSTSTAQLGTCSNAADEPFLELEN